MTLVNLTGLEASVGTPTVLTGTVKVQRWAGGAPAVTLSGEKVIFSPDVTIALIGGEPSVPLALEPTTDEWHYRITVADSLSPRALTVDVAVPDQTSIDFDDLPRVDPSSGLPLVPGTQGVGGLPGLHQVTVSGVTSLAVLHEHTYELNATAPATVTLNGVPGAQVAIIWSGSAGTLEGTTTADGQTYVAVRLTAGWKIYTVGVSAPPPDTTAPTAGTLTVVTSYTTADLTVTGAMDDVALHAAPYRFSKDNGASWAAWQAAATYQFAGLASGTSFPFQHMVRDAAGNVKTGTAVVKSTATPPTWTLWAQDDFTGSDGTIVGRSTPTGGRTWVAPTGGPDGYPSWTDGQFARIASNKLAFGKPAEGWLDVAAGVAYPPVGTEGRVRVTFDYDLNAYPDATLWAIFPSNVHAQPFGVLMKKGTVASFRNDSGDSWTQSPGAIIPPDSGTAVAECSRSASGDLTFQLTVGGTVVCAATGTGSSTKPPSTVQVGIGCYRADTSTITVDNFKVEYVA